MTVADQIEKAFDNITVQMLMQGVEITKKTSDSVYTQTTPESAEKDVHAEWENNLDNTTKRKVLFQYTSEPQPEMLKFMKQHRGYDNVQLEAPRATQNQNKFDERVCLANALQFHIEDLVDGIIFHESELPDCLLAEGCLTEDECSTVRKLGDRKDQIRVLVSHTKGHDLCVLIGFMKHIQQHNPDVAKPITEMFESNKRDGVRGKLCALFAVGRYANPEMNVTKANKKKHIRPKTEVTVSDISQPFDFRHDIHVGHEDYEERLVDSLPVSPPAPCPCSKDTSGDASIPSESISQLLREEIIPALRLEIGDIVESKLKVLLDDKTRTVPILHCQTCSCTINERGSSIVSESEYPNTGEQSRILFETPEPCAAVTVEDINIPANITRMRVISVNDIQDHGDDTHVSKTFSNPIYHHKEKTFLIQTQQGAKLIKYGSDIQLACKELSSSRSLVLERSNTLPGLIKNVQSPKLKRNDEPHNHRGRPLSKADERECMAHALQWHIGDLVDGIIFKDSELPDSLLADGCLTEEECSGVRKKLDRKDQVRVLLRIIKGRDLDILKRFLRHIRTHNESVANRIEEKFKQNQTDGVRCSKCVFCILTSQVNLKYLVDSLWKHSLIEDGLFNLIVETDKPTGEQGDLWHRVIYSLNSHKRSNVRDIVVKALTVKNHYTHIAQGVGWMISTNGALACRCEIHLNIASTGSFTSLVSSRSPATSESEFVADSRSDISRISSKTDTITLKEPSRGIINTNAVKVHSLVHEVSHDAAITEPLNGSQVTTMQLHRVDGIQQDSSVKLKPPIAPRKRITVNHIAHFDDELASDV